MAENIIIKITGESDFSDVNKDFDSLKKKEADIVSGMEAIKKKQEEFAGAPKVISLLDAEYKKLDKDLKTTKQSLTDLNSKLGNVNDTLAKGAVQTPKLRTQIMELTDQLAKMEMAGDTSSKQFINLSVQAGKLKDQMGDTRQTITVLSSDTRALDTAMGLGQGLAGAFSVATSASALLGGENEELQKAFFKVQAVMSILNGVNEVALMLNKNSVVMVNLRTAAEQSNTLAKIKNWGVQTASNVTTTVATGLESKNIIVKGASTVAQWALNSAMLASPITWLIVGIMAVVGAFVYFTKSSDEAKSAQDSLNKSMLDTEERMNRVAERTDIATRVLEAMGKSSRNQQLEGARETLRIAEENYKKQEEALKKAGEDATDIQKENYNKSKQVYKDSIKELKDLKTDFAIEDIKSQTDANNEAKKKQKDADNAALKAKKDHKNKLLAELKKINEKQKNLLKEDIDNVVEYDSTLINRVNNSFTATEIAAKEHSDKMTKFLAPLHAMIANGKADDIKMFQENERKKGEILEASFALGQELSNTVFSIAQDQAAKELADLDQYYTTDAEAAKNNSNLKLISENELAKKKLEIRRKQAVMDKSEALFNIALSTAQNIVAAAGKSTWLIPFIIATSALQAAVVMSRPLPAYAKGRKGGKGETALVGERGPELMYVPDGASIIPAHLTKNMSMQTMLDYGMLPSNMSGGIDYDKLGRAVAENVHIPTQKSVSVNIDKNGILVRDGNNTTSYLQSKYSARWS